MTDHPSGASATSWYHHYGFVLNIPIEAALMHQNVLLAPADIHTDIAVNYCGIQRDFTAQEFLLALGFSSPSLEVPHALSE
jgi:hypothetical protein